MKRFLLIAAACFPPSDCRLQMLNRCRPIRSSGWKTKRIVVKDNGERMKVKVYELTEEGDSIDSEMIFEGHYRDGQSYERRKHIKSINIPIPSWDKDFDPHWAGFGMGFANFSGSDGINDVDGVSLRSGNSLEYNLNFMEFSFPFSRYRWAVVTGAGMRWSRYRLDMNAHFQEVDGVTQLVFCSRRRQGYNNASKLNITSLTIPVLLEWQSPQTSSQGSAFLYLRWGGRCGQNYFFFQNRLS
ncbi:MAG: PorT family protein [Parabacteroides merdae]